MHTASRAMACVARNLRPATQAPVICDLPRTMPRSRSPGTIVRSNVLDVLLTPVRCSLRLVSVVLKLSRVLRASPVHEPSPSRVLCLEANMLQPVFEKLSTPASTPAARPIRDSIEGSRFFSRTINLRGSGERWASNFPAVRLIFIVDFGAVSVNVRMRDTRS